MLYKEKIDALVKEIERKMDEIRGLAEKFPRETVITSRTLPTAYTEPEEEETFYVGIHRGSANFVVVPRYVATSLPDAAIIGEKKDEDFLETEPLASLEKINEELGEFIENFPFQ